MRTILVLASLVDGEVDTPTLELLTLARGLGAPVALVPGEVAGAATAELGRYGASTVVAVQCPELATCLVTALAGLVTDAARDLAADLVLVPAGAEATEVAALVAASLDGALVTDAVAVGDDDGSLRVTKVVGAGRYTVEALVRTPRAVLTVKAGAVPATPGGGCEPTTTTRTYQHPAGRYAVVTAFDPAVGADGPRLTEASIVVAGGRGTGGDFGPIEALADLLGGAVGASRAAVDEGWAASVRQVGQTGSTVSPDLYVALGISGAVQHLAGMRTARRIVAVNSDPDAPIHKVADLAVVGDLAVVVPAAIERLRART